MNIGDLPTVDCCIEISQVVSEMTRLFDRNPAWPGVILVSAGKVIGIISRGRCFEALGKPYGIEIFSKRPVREFFNEFGETGLRLDAHTSIQAAVKAALDRAAHEVYNPIVVCFDGSRYALLSMQVLLQAQCDLLEKLSFEFQQLSIRDPLTNLRNRRGFFEAAVCEVTASQSQQSDLSALMIDIDHFKLTNDIYGHVVGDCVIRSVAEECQAALRQTDLLGRFGGEEFIALLPNTSLETACTIAERLRVRVENLVVFVNGFQVSVTISVGVCTLQDTKGSLDNLLTQADQAMYAAKWSGRNQVIVWDPQIAHRVRKDLSKSYEPETFVNKWHARIRTDATRVYDETIEGWAKAPEMRDKETEGHAHRVSSLAVELARRMGIDEVDLVDIRRGALLHDIGKIAVPDQILLKAGPLSEDEWAIMRKHPVHAFELLSPILYLQKCIDIPYCHHEHWDGSGYPCGLKGEEIPLPARIFTVIDVWDALSTNRCYRPAWSEQEVRRYIAGQAGHLFDPVVTAVFLDLLETTQIQSS